MNYALTKVEDITKEGGELHTMTQLKRQIIAVLAAGLLVPTNAFAATSLTISGNGSYSDSKVELENSNNTTVVQSNQAVVTNNVTSSSKTGGNVANDNTGGDVRIETGKATSVSNVENTLNSNMAKLDCCDDANVDVTISGNGTHSDNEVEFDQKGDATSVFQNNTALVTNNVESTAKTGGNDAKRSTGGDVTIVTGNAVASNDVSTAANVNRATIGGGFGHNNGELSAVITGNGSDTDNSIELDLSKETTIVQDNEALVLNYVDAAAKTGWNDANDNTGGEVHIKTGKASAYSVVDNMVNFNAADIDCGCLLDAEAKISGNGTDSDNEIEAELGDDRSVFQGGREGTGNTALLTNEVDSSAKSGANEAEFNTGDVEGDPSITTGDAESLSEVENSGNTNVYGRTLDFDFPEVDVNVNLSLVLNQIALLLAM